MYINDPKNQRTVCDALGNEYGQRGEARKNRGV